MKRLTAVAVLLVLVGCGSAESGSGDDADGGATSPGTAMVGGCAEDAPEVEQATVLTEADLDGDGSAEQVKLTAAGGECGNLLFAQLGEGYVATKAPADEPPVTGAFAIAPPGQEGQLLVTRADHPRGGYQLHVYAADGEDLTELTVDDQPLVPFVATDVQEHPFSIDCSDDGFVFTDAVAHEPVGIVATWDVQETTYAVDGTSVTAGAPKEIADNVMSDQLGASYPELARHAAFASCRA